MPIQSASRFVTPSLRGLAVRFVLGAACFPLAGPAFADAAPSWPTAPLPPEVRSAEAPARARVPANPKLAWVLERLASEAEGTAAAAAQERVQVEILVTPGAADACCSTCRPPRRGSIRGTDRYPLSDWRAAGHALCRRYLHVWKEIAS